MAGPTVLILGLLAGVASSAGKEGVFTPPSRGDDVGSMPCGAPVDFPSLMLLASRADLDLALLSAQGSGEMRLWPLGAESDLMLVEFEGAFTLTLDQGMLASGRVHTLFGVGAAFAGGTADVLVQGRRMHAGDLQELAVYELPPGFLANDVSPTVIHAGALGGESFTLVSTPSNSSVVVRQVPSF
jgi:hypothetical protein